MIEDTVVKMKDDRQANFINDELHKMKQSSMKKAKTRHTTI